MQPAPTTMHAPKNSKKMSGEIHVCVLWSEDWTVDLSDFLKRWLATFNFCGQVVQQQLLPTTHLCYDVGAPFGRHAIRNLLLWMPLPPPPPARIAAAAAPSHSDCHLTAAAVPSCPGCSHRLVVNSAHSMNSEFMG